MNIKASKNPIVVAGMASLITMFTLFSGAADTALDEVHKDAPILITALREG